MKGMKGKMFINKRSWVLWLLWGIMVVHALWAVMADCVRGTLCLILGVVIVWINRK